MRKFMSGVSLAVWMFFGVMAYPQGPSWPRLSGHDFRRIAKVIVTPEFPDDAIKFHRTGVAVADVRVNEKGNVVGVEILEAPSPSIATSVSQSLAQWRFAPGAAHGHATGYMGKVTYYFVFADGKPLALAPDQAPYVGRWRTRP